jgi:hypothetical protein
MAERVGIQIPHLLLPKPEYREVWPVVACDQFTSQIEYWEQVKRIVGNKPSTLNIILPEVYLETPQEKDLIEEKVRNMKIYLKENIFVERTSFVYLERKTRTLPRRRGLVVALDLENYSFQKGAEFLIRPTEQTVVERIPPRLKIRSRALIETPHILILINDPQQTVIEPLTENKGKLENLYDQDLMLDSGNIKGYAVDGDYAAKVIQALNKLLDQSVQEVHNQNQSSPSKTLSPSKTFQATPKHPVLYLVGDGNHSLATAKQSWENIKDELKRTRTDAAFKRLYTSHPARFCLVELSNLYDEGNQFEAIHRVLFGVKSSLIEFLKKELASDTIFQVHPVSSYKDLATAVYAQSDESNNATGFFFFGRVVFVII